MIEKYQKPLNTLLIVKKFHVPKCVWKNYIFSGKNNNISQNKPFLEVDKVKKY